MRQTFSYIDELFLVLISCKNQLGSLPKVNPNHLQPLGLMRL